MSRDVIDEVVRAYIARNVHKPLHAAAVAALDRTVKLVFSDAQPDLSEYDLTWAGWQTLMLLFYSRHQRLPITRLAKRTGAHATTVTRTVDRLVRSGYARRVADSQDRRVNIIELTKAGEIAQDAVAAHQAERGWGLAALNDDDVSTLLDLLKKIRVSLGDNDY